MAAPVVRAPKTQTNTNRRIIKEVYSREKSVASLVSADYIRWDDSLWEDLVAREKVTAARARRETLAS